MEAEKLERVESDDSLISDGAIPAIPTQPDDISADNSVQPAQIEDPEVKERFEAGINSNLIATAVVCPATIRLTASQHTNIVNKKN